MGAGGRIIARNERIGSRAFQNMSKLPLEPNIRGERAIWSWSILCFYRKIPRSSRIQIGYPATVVSCVHMLKNHVNILCDSYHPLELFRWTLGCTNFFFINFPMAVQNQIFEKKSFSLIFFGFKKIVGFLVGVCLQSHTQILGFWGFGQFSNVIFSEKKWKKWKSDFERLLENVWKRSLCNIRSIGTVLTGGSCRTKC